MTAFEEHASTYISGVQTTTIWAVHLEDLFPELKYFKDNMVYNDAANPI
jgi:hypothetical protein